MCSLHGEASFFLLFSTKFSALRRVWFSNEPPHQISLSVRRSALRPSRDALSFDTAQDGELVEPFAHAPRGRLPETVSADLEVLAMAKFGGGLVGCS
ncbi:MAG: hypothetical protein A3B37_03500 [Candidatus Sungbacteria bacterium RIFCSPLOWO2_01_FULL_59_16]|uniref:Uncharacterized protein n=1 Tax=Candidatus Sungbacteria bacterium RIFCSPLOWO2_01_FULL_59_16 TaxID=1802280 RepID=A0A1G2LCC2_9BACT|nr:MAG: hypothetical protein A3B37_03500 [Candidatus Sungbacteria bacterium RIFCSPLOWO2_01_FULL_59_16]